MLRSLLAFMAIAIPQCVCAQERDTAKPATQAEPPVATVEPSETSSLFNDIREAVLRPDSGVEARRTSAAILVRAESDEANGLVVELLRFTENPQVQLAVCTAIDDHVRERSGVLAAVFVDPLVELLAASDAELRSAAAGTLSQTSSESVIEKLGALVRDPTATATARLAALSALAPNIDHPTVVPELISVLDGEAGEITQSAAAMLEESSGQTFGEDPAQWRTWWATMETSWTAHRLDSYRNRLREMERKLSELVDGSTKTKETLTNRLVSFQRECFRSVTSEQREVKLAEWLRDPVLDVRRTALTIITGRMGDEGYRPTGAVLEALLWMVSKESTGGLRREALTIVENLNDPKVVQSILAALEHEADRATRCAMLRALGKLGGQDAIPMFVEEIAAKDTTNRCPHEAAVALGTVAGRSADTELVASTVEPLKKCYASIAEDDRALRAAILEGMAGVASASFTDVFLEAVESNDADILRPAIRGLCAIGDSSRVARFRTLTGHDDSGVRLVSIDAVGRFGNDDADIECLLARFNPKVEPHAAAREAAWTGFGKLLKHKPVKLQLDWAQRLQELDGLRLAFLAELEKNLASQNGGSPDLETVRNRLATTLADQGKYAEAVIYLRGLYASVLARSDASAGDCGLRLLDALLRSGVRQGVAEMVSQLAKSATDEDSRTKIVDAVSAYIESEEVLANKETAAGLLAQLRLVPADSMGERWSAMLERVEEKINPPAPAPQPEPTPAPPPSDQTP